MEGLSTQDAARLLAWHCAMGADAAIADSPLDRFQPAAAPAPESSVARARPAVAPVAPPVPAPSVPASSAPPPPVPASSTTLAAAADSLDALRQTIEQYDGCALKRACRSTVFADGVAGAPVMIVGEAPGGEEDRQGRPFVGQSGQLLDRMLAAVGLSRDRTVYISNILPWRPPGNRDPNAEELALCLPFLERHIALARPALVVPLGKTAAHALLRSNAGISRLRGRWTRLPDLDIPCLPTFHPAYLLRQPAMKARAWSDWLSIRSFLEEKGLVDPPFEGPDTE